MKRTALAIAVWLLSAHGSADGARDDARGHFQSGLNHARRGDWSRALDEFTVAYRSAPEPAVLFNLAGAQFRCGKLLAANTNYRRLVAGKQLSSAQRAAASAQIARIEQRMPRLRVHIEGLREDDRVLLDKARLYPDELDRDMWVDPGSHEIAVLRRLGGPETRTTTLAEGEHRVLALSLP